MGREMNMRSSMSLSFVGSCVWVGVLSFVSVRFMSSVISFAGYRLRFESFVSKTLMFAVKL